MSDGWTIVPGVGDRPTVAISPSRDMSVSIDGGKLHVLFDDSVAATNAVAVPASVLAALSAPPPALTIEQLVDALVDKTWWCAQAGKSEVDAAKAECNAARSALLAAIRSQAPADRRRRHPGAGPHGVPQMIARAACTGLTATWCPVHGDCRCPPAHEGGDPCERSLDDDACPLHARDSDHGEERAADAILRVDLAVPADLAGLLRENLAAYEAWLSGVDDGDSLRFNRSQKAIADWTRASLGDPE